MKRFMAMVLVMAMVSCWMLTGCQQQSAAVVCASCGTEAGENAKFCAECGETLPEPTDPEAYCEKCGQLLPLTDEDIPQSDFEKIDLALAMMIERWQDIAYSDENNDGYFEIKNTRIIWLDGTPVEFFGNLYYADCVVEFNIYTDHEGAAPYYFETEYQNEVIFYSDGTTELSQDVADWVWDPDVAESLAGRYTVVDYGTTFNQTINLYEYIPTVEVSAADAPADDAPAADAPVEDEPADEPQEILPKDDTNYSLLDMGSCNGNVYWEIRSNGVLYIYGIGTIPNYEWREVDGALAPWIESAVCSQITDVVISDGITGIGEHAFSRLYLSSIYFGHDVITYAGDSYGLCVQTAYIPASMQDVDEFLGDSYKVVGGGSSYYYTTTIYYEGTEEEWESKLGYYANKDSVNSYDVYYNYEY